MIAFPKDHRSGPHTSSQARAALDGSASASLWGKVGVCDSGPVRQGPRPEAEKYELALTCRS